ncbi:hypothetical protein AMTR_s00099p00110810 [Amborella trichopoda]|uniref:Uncharacterized protein n=1 Tax=Amborella trichopoda TaxID=13333 RepID=W1NWP4_AMBTC|nr:hypothetical protein AMTR_s00099p00110810 [Amborella trichopoda]
MPLSGHLQLGRLELRDRRYSDGRLVIDFVAKSLGLPYLSAYLDSVGTNFSHGANFATAGSTIRPQNTTLTQTGYSPISLHNVYWQGGRYFWIHNTGPVGCLSYVLHRLPVLAPQVDNAGCAIPFNQVVQYFNQLLKETVIRLRSDLPDVTFAYVDVYSVKYQLISEAPKYGFGNPLRACCGHGGKYKNNNFGCGSAIICKLCNHKLGWCSLHTGCESMGFRENYWWYIL